MYDALSEGLVQDDGQNGSMAHSLRKQADKKFKLYLFYKDYETSYTTSCSLTLMFALGWSSCGRKSECPEETHLSDLVTTWSPSHMPTLGIEPGSQWWEASALTLCQPDSLIDYLGRLLSLGWGALRVSVFHSPFRIWKAIKAGHSASPGSSCVKTYWYWQLSRYTYCQLQR